MRPDTLALPNAHEYERKALHHSVRHVADLADALCGITNEQTLIHHRDVSRAHEDSIARMHRR